MTPTVLSTKLGITRSQNPDCLSGLVFMTHTHVNFECLSPSQEQRDYAYTKSELAYEQNTYLIHRKMFKIIELTCT
jgi:hypothetical protein